MNNEPTLQCIGKERYDSKQDASKVANRIGGRRSGQRVKLASYRCRFCRGWHLGRENYVKPEGA